MEWSGEPSPSAFVAKRTLPARLIGALPAALGAGILAWLSIRAIYAKLGHPGAPLDDSFIHFEYARAWAEGHPFRYEAGEPRTMGATSAIWPLLLAPFYLVGFRGMSILWPAWLLGFGALAVLAREMVLLARPLSGRQAAIGAGAMTLAFGPFVWFAGSGMEVVPFALALTRVARRSSEWMEGLRNPSRERELVLLAFLVPLLRPEGSIASLVIAAALALASFRAGRRRFPLALLAATFALGPQLLSWAVTGHARGNTAIVKLMPGNPYLVGSALVEAVGSNLRVLVKTLLDGDVWSAEFLPHGSAPFAFTGLGCIAISAYAERRFFRGAVVLLFAAGICIPALYVTFLWNRLRYLWPFAPFWILGVACFARLAGEQLARLRTSFRVATPLTVGLVAGLFASKLDGVIDDLAESASGIDRQQVALGLWADRHIPAGARIGVNDTGAIAYVGNHPTFDIVGLTTNGEGRYWVAGAASRFEHYERLWQTAPERLPTYFIVYPQWMACDAVLGTELHEAVVNDSTILGGTTMVVYEADWSRLGSGERPWTPLAEVVDSLDVADLDSEAAHGYELLGTPDQTEELTTAETPDGRMVTDGGRRERARERFRVLASGALQGVARLEPSEPTRVSVRVDGKTITSFPLTGSSWEEVSFELTLERAGAVVELIPDDGTLTTYHYWFARKPS